MNEIPYECDPKWMRSYMNVIPYEWRNDTPNAIGCTSIWMRSHMNVMPYECDPIWMKNWHSKCNRLYVVVHVNEVWHIQTSHGTCEQVTSHIWMCDMWTCRGTYEYVISHLWTSYTQIHTHMSHIHMCDVTCSHVPWLVRMCHVTLLNELCTNSYTGTPRHTCTVAAMSHGTHMDESWHTYEWVYTYIYVCIHRHTEAYVRSGCSTNEWVMLHIRMSHDTRMNEYTHIYTYVNTGTPRFTCAVAATHMNESCCTYEWVMAHISMSIHIYTQIFTQAHWGVLAQWLQHTWISHVTHMR